MTQEDPMERTTKKANQEIRVAAKEFAEAFQKLATTLLRGATAELGKLEKKAQKKAQARRAAVKEALAHVH